MTVDPNDVKTEVFYAGISLLNMYHETILGRMEDNLRIPALPDTGGGSGGGAAAMATTPKQLQLHSTYANCTWTLALIRRLELMFERVSTVYLAPPGSPQALANGASQRANEARARGETVFDNSLYVDVDGHRAKWIVILALEASK